MTRASLAGAPLLLIGTLTPASSANQPQHPPDVFRIGLALADLKTGLIVARSQDRATAGTVNASPTPYYQESPTWHVDATLAGYVRACQPGSGAGDPVDPAYLERLPAAAVLNEATLAYDARHYAEAYRLFHEAGTIADPDDLRVLNGLYLTSLRLGRTGEARAAFERIVDVGLNSKRLMLKLPFVPGTTNLAGGRGLSGQYDMWLRAVAAQAARRGACVQVIGHASHSGAATLNDALSLKRARAVESRLERDARTLAGRLSSEGRGFRENLVGTGTDDPRDALDRRVEFRVVDCR